MNEAISISIVVPVLQEEKLLEHTLACFPPAVRRLRNIELIVSDGGSTDASIEIATRMADVVVQHKEARKQTIAEGRNAGAKVARGEVIVFINGDTFPADTEIFISTIENFRIRHGKYRRASALACAVDFPEDERTAADEVFHTFYNSYVRLLNWCRIGAGRGECQIVRREVFERVRGYRSSLAAGEDFDLYARISRIARVRFASEIVVIESPRRFRKFGYLRVLWWWTLNALSVMFTGHSSSDEWEPVR